MNTVLLAAYDVIAGYDDDTLNSMAFGFIVMGLLFVVAVIVAVGLLVVALGLPIAWLVARWQQHQGTPDPQSSDTVWRVPEKKPPSG